MHSFYIDFRDFLDIFLLYIIEVYIILYINTINFFSDFFFCLVLTLLRCLQLAN